MVLCGNEKLEHNVLATCHCHLSDGEIQIAVSADFHALNYQHEFNQLPSRARASWHLPDSASLSQHSVLSTPPI